jgi:SAM-dependent methyltransferase
MRQLNDAELVRAQYADEANLGARKAIYGDREGPDARDVVFQAVANCAPRCVLEVGGGEGELAERIARELGVDLTFVDQSERMVEIARGRGLDARIGDVQQLPFADGTFDTAVAAWMLYHVPDLERGLRELARVLAPGGHLVAVTNAVGHLRELRQLFGRDFDSPFTRENAEELLLRHFATVERYDVDGLVTIHDRAQVVAYRDSMMTTDKSRDLEFDVPLQAHTHISVFVATK